MGTTNTGIGAALKFFGKQPGQSTQEFAAEWQSLTDGDKADLVSGIEDGTLNYG